VVTMGSHPKFPYDASLCLNFIFVCVIFKFFSHTHTHTHTHIYTHIYIYIYIYIYKRVLHVLLSRSKFHVSDTRISVSRVIVSGDLAVDL
jgi:hypothetical protein